MQQNNNIFIVDEATFPFLNIMMSLDSVIMWYGPGDREMCRGRGGRGGGGRGGDGGSG